MLTHHTELNEKNNIMAKKKLSRSVLKQAAKQLGSLGGKASAKSKKKAAAKKKGKKRTTSMKNGVLTVKYK